MNTILEVFQKDIAKYPFRTIIDNLIDDQIYECIEEYANQFKTEWKYPSKNEFPEIKAREIIVVERKTKKVKSFHVPNETYKTFYFDFKEHVVAWCELPVFVTN